MKPVLPELTLAEVPAYARDRFDGDRFSYMAAGDTSAPVVLLLHGSGASASYWRHQFAALSGRFRLVAWNAPGYGLSDPLSNPTPSYDDYADALAAFCDSLQIRRASLVGNSFGAGLALTYASRQPDRVHRMALSGVSAGARGRSQSAQAQNTARRGSYFEDGSGAFAYARAVLDLVCSPQAPEPVRREIMDVLATTNARGYRAVRHASSQADPLAFAATIQAQTLLYHGTDDRVNPLQAGAAALAAALPHARLLRLQGCGHLPEIEMADEVNAQLNAFLQEGRERLAG